MIRLSNTTKKLQAVLAGAITTNQPQAVVSFFDENVQGEDTRGADQETNLNSTTDVDICNALGTGKEGYTRNIDTLTIYNRDTVSATVTVKIDDGGTETVLIMATLAPNATLTYDHESGWNVVTGTDFLLALVHFGGRLTLASGTPVMTSDDTGNTTVYFTPYNGNLIPIYNGTYMVPTEFTELSQATTDTTKSPAAVANNSNYDLFVWNDSGTIRCTRGPAWTSDTARGTGAGTTELEMVKGVYVNKIAITNGPAAQRGTYVGSVRSNGTATIDDTMAFRHVWNMYNRVTMPMRVIESTDNWSYTTATWRQANANTANQLSMIRGLNEDSVKAVSSSSGANNGGSAQFMSGVGENSTSALATGAIVGVSVTSGANVNQNVICQYTGFPGLGRAYLAWIEISVTTSGTTNWHGDNGQPTQMQNGIHAEVRA